MQYLNDKELFVLVSEGDEEAFRELFHSYNRMLSPFVIKLTGSLQAAEEVLQEVFLKIWLHRSKLTTIESPKGWIVRIASNEAMNWLEKRAHQGRLLEKLKQLPKNKATSPDQIFDEKQIKELLREAVEQLPFSRREIYKMSREHDMKISEIANTLKLSPNTVKNQLVKALSHIRKHVQKGLGLFLLVLIMLSFFFATEAALNFIKPVLKDNIMLADLWYAV